MSSCVVVSDGKQSFMASDTAISSFLENKPVRVSNDFIKIFNLFDSLVFCSGEIESVNRAVSYIRSLSSLDFEKISEYLRSNILMSADANIFSIEILVLSLVNNFHVLTQISEYNNFSVVQRNLEQGKGIQVYSAGFKTEEVLDRVCSKIENHKDVLSSLKETFLEISSPQIGGNLHIWSLSNTITKIYDDKIDSVPLYSNLDFSHLIVADVIVGRLLAGNSLTISNDKNNFILDESGAYLNNATFAIQTTNTRVIIDPTSTIPFRIQKNTGGTFRDNFWADNVGNVNFSGSLSGATGTFSGQLVAATGTFAGSLSAATGTFSGQLVAATGTFAGSLSAATGTFAGSLSAATGTFAGSLSAATGTFRGQLQAATGTFSGDISAASGTFRGNIYADKIYGQVVDSQIASGIDAGKITVGTMAADRIYGGTISWPGASMGNAGYGYAFIHADVNLELSGASDAILVSDYLTVQGYEDVLLTSEKYMNIEGMNGIRLYGPIHTTNGSNRGWGITGTINPNSYNNFYFVNGILVNYY
jgi:predicted phage tail protein